jgi:CheY-like chemotaxis protein
VVREAAARQIEACGARAVVTETRAALLERAPEDAVLLIDHALRGKAPADRKAIVLLRPDERGRIARSRASGFAGYLIKPLRRASLAARVLAALGAETTAAVEDERIAPAAAPGKRVLLAEDNPINALLARTLLQREGCQVDRVASGEEALAALQAGTYDLVLMDVRMPGMTGTQATRALRSRGIKTPVVALTADAFEDDRKACLDAGMDDVLVKPLNPDALRGALVRWTNPAAQAKVASAA